MPSLFESMSQLGVIESNEPKEPIAPIPISQAIYVSTRLDIIKLPAGSNSPEEIEREGITFQRLTPQYFAWLNRKVNGILLAHEQKRVPDAQWNMLRERFTEINILAVKIFGPDKIREAVENPLPDSHLPSQPKKIAPSFHWHYPSHGTFAFTESVTKEAIDKVNAILPDALSKSWKEHQLLQNRGNYSFPCGQDYGLACFMDGTKTIGAITESYIEIVDTENPNRPVTMRFHNSLAPQAWLRRSDINP